MQESNITELIRTEKTVNQRADVHVRYRIQNIDDINDFIEVESNGSGVDTQDKAIGKAMTYAYKYMLLRTFAIPTGEDPDKISSDEIDAKIEKQKQEELKEKVIGEPMHKALIKAIENKGITDMEVSEILHKYGYSVTNEIKLKDYKAICDDFSKLKKV